jgi:hypothetical protein
MSQRLASNARKNISWEDIAALLKKGLGAREIAIIHGCSVQNIQARIKRHREKATR